MTDRKLFGETTLIADFTKTLIKVETLEEGSSIKYLDKQTGNYWLKYVADDGSSLPNLMLISPPLTADDLIEVAIISNFPDEVLAAATRLSLEEQYEEKEFREKLVTRLETVVKTALNKGEKKRLKTIIEASQLVSRINQREILGKHIFEIQRDAAFFSSIADRAQKILNQL